MSLGKNCEVYSNEADRHLELQSKCSESLRSSKDCKIGNLRDSPIKSKVSSRIMQADFEGRCSLRLNEEEKISDFFIKQKVPAEVFVVVGQEEKVLGIKVNLDPDTTVKDIISIAVSRFAEMIENNTSSVRMKRDLNLYALKPSKKTGKAKVDLPNFEETASVSRLNVDKFSLVCKNGQYVIKDFIDADQIKGKKAKIKCKNCSIL